VPGSAEPSILTREAANRVIVSGQWFYNSTGLVCKLGNTTASLTEWLNETFVACNFAANALSPGANAVLVRNDAATGFVQWPLPVDVYGASAWE